jgi:hypothetical protein
MGAILANVLSIPHASGKLLAAGAALPALTPGGMSFSDARAAQEKKLPASALLAIPDVSTEEVLAAPSAVRRSLSDPMVHRRRLVGQRFDEALADEEKRAADNPIGSSAGQTAGDVGSMLTLRPGQRTVGALGFNPRADFTDTKGKLDAAGRLFARGTARTAEAGVDGAVMGALGDADPAKTAAYSAGIQAAGSAALTAKSVMLRNPLKSFFGLYLGHEMWKSLAPGPQDLFTSKDSAVNELVGAYVAGTAAAVLGSGRGIGGGNVRAITDAMSSTSRATIASVVTQLQEAQESGDGAPSRVLELMSANPDHFGKDARVLLERAARSEEPRALLNQIDQLMQSTRFRKALEEADAPTEEPPSPRQSFGDWLMRR